MFESKKTVIPDPSGIQIQLAIPFWCLECNVSLAM